MSRASVLGGRTHALQHTADLPRLRNLSKFAFLPVPVLPEVKVRRWTRSLVCRGCKARLRSERISTSMGQKASRQLAASSSNVAAVHVEGSQEEVPQDLMSDMIEFLKEDLPNLFNEKGIDKSKYDQKVAFIDPITKYDNLNGYLLNIQMLRFLFSPIFELRNIKQSGQSEITTRWCMRLYFRLVPWQPEVVFTGRSIMTVNPATGKFNRHIDLWDSIEDNDYFSLEGLQDFLKQVLNLAQTPKDKQVPFDILKRTAKYEIRKYPAFSVLDASPSGEHSLEDMGIFNQFRESLDSKTPAMLPLLSWVRGAGGRECAPSIPVEASVHPSSVTVREVPSGCMAVVRFSGSSSERSVAHQERELRGALQRDGLHAEEGYALARYYRAKRLPLLGRNEVWIRLRDYELG